MFARFTFRKINSASSKLSSWVSNSNTLNKSEAKGDKQSTFKMPKLSKIALPKLPRSRRVLLVVLLLSSSAAALTSPGIWRVIMPMSNPIHARYGAPSMVEQNGEAVWMDDAAPVGATLYSAGGDGWTWLNGNPNPYSGTVSHQSNIVSSNHQHYFEGASQTLDVGAEDRLFAYVYLDPANIPSEVMLQWNENGSSGMAVKAPDILCHRCAKAS